MDQREGDGTLHANTVLPATRVTYTFLSIGTWAPYSDYRFYENLSGYWGENEFTTNWSFNQAVPFETISGITTGKESPMWLSLTDANDNGVATANYYLTFHRSYDGWSRNNAATVIHPLSVTTHLEDWVAVGVLDNHAGVSYTEERSNQYAITRSMFRYI
ncbi:MAG: hypothetical protein C4321_07250 [Chloroflexota bacterium]